MNQTLEEFLEYKTLYYDKIDYDVIKKGWEQLKSHISLPYVIHIVGTNGKGSTGRFLASFLNQLNKKTIHYTSPHIIKFNERIWINGKDSSDDQLNKSHINLQNILSQDILEKLTYFEYTTLLALYLSDGYDYIVLEAGLGGEFDATNVVENNLTVVPSIGLDHMDFLGDTIEEIATTKLKSCDNSYILAIDINPIVLNIEKNVLKNKNKIYFDNNVTIKNIELLPKYLQNNIRLSLNVLKYLNLSNNNLKIDTITGRFQKIYKNITIDVGHNTLAANAIVRELKDKQIVLVYNSYKDKDYTNILKVFKNNIKEVQIIFCDDKRIVEYNILQSVCKELDIKCSIFNINKINNNEEYLVFGSFKVVEEFIKLKVNIEK